MKYVDELKNFEELYNMFIYKAEASVFLDTVKELHLEEAYMTWLNDHFKDEVYDYALPIKVEINVSDIKACVITVMKDFREVFEERQTKEEE